jgi:hypothetical protein
MKNLWRRAASVALLGALTGAGALVAAFNLHPQIAFEMDRDLPGRALSGTYPAEINGDDSFAWASDRALLNIQGVDRRFPWTCTASFRGGRSPEHPQPDVSFVLDNQVLATRTATNEYQSIEAMVPARPQQRGLRLALTSSKTFVPGPADPRQLGVQLDRLACAPERGHVVLPPSHTLAVAAATAAIFGVMFALVGVSLWPVVAGTLAVASVQAIPLSMGVGPYMPYVDRVLWVAIWLAIVATGGVLLTERLRPLSGGARFAVAFSAAVLFVKLLALLHPSKAIIDALFHAHRLDYVLGGRYFFTQVMPGGVQFPYSIALYVFAAPWASLTRDHVALLRVVVSASEALAGVLLYWAVASRWRDAAAAALTVVVFHLLPVSFWVIGNANLTNAFGQQAALAAMAGLIAWRLGTKDWAQWLGLAALAALAILAHVSTAALLIGTMLTAAVIARIGGGKAEMPAARSIVLAVAIAIVASVAVYYGRAEFYDAYRSVGGAQAEAGAHDKAGVTEEAATSTRLAEGAIPVMSLWARIQNAVLLGGDALGWPLLALAVLGGWRAAVEPSRDRLMWAVLAWAITCGIFFVFGIVAPGGVGHQRQAMEFIARAVYAGAPAMLILAGRGGLWAWRAGSSLRFVAIFLLTIAVFGAARSWFNWIR